MYQLVAATTDHTGRTINLLTIGLVVIAVALAGLTVWYWRQTCPRRRLETTDPASGRQPVALRDPIDVTSLGSTRVDDTTTGPVMAVAGDLAVVDERVDLAVVDERVVVDVAPPVPEPMTKPMVNAPDPVADSIAGPGADQIDELDGSETDRPDGRPDTQHGLEDDQWALLAEAVFAEFLDGNDGGSEGGGTNDP